MTRALLLSVFLIGNVYAAEKPTERKKTSIGIYAGSGEKGIKTEQKGSTLVVERERGLVYGIGIGYKPLESIGFRIIGISNSTILGGAELDF